MSLACVTVGGFPKDFCVPDQVPYLHSTSHDSCARANLVMYGASSEPCFSPVNTASHAYVRILRRKSNGRVIVFYSIGRRFD